MKKHLFTRVLSLLLVVAMLAGFAMPVQATHQHGTTESEEAGFTRLEDSISVDRLHEAEETQEEIPYADTDIVRISIVLANESTLEAGFAAQDIAANAQAMAYRAELKAQQEDLTASIESALGTELKVRWNLTLAANIISADVEYGQIETIAAVPGVEKVILSQQYEPAVVDEGETYDPNMSTSTKQIGSTLAWTNGYTGAGSKIAIIDTGVDADHQSFSPEGLAYSFAYNAGKLDMDPKEYTESLNLMTADDIAAVRDQLNVPAQFTAEDLYVNTKIAFGYNYIDGDLDITHDNDTQGGHGSHVTGIATANAFIAKADGTFINALNSVFVQGVAPDAQLLTMKVFGKGGGAYQDDYMAAIEDAIILGADAVNLSLGSATNGFITDATYQELLDSLTASGTVATMSASNAATWAQYSKVAAAHLYADDINFWTGGSPGSYTNSLSVASVDNCGRTGYSFSVNGEFIFYTQTSYKNLPLYTVGGQREYVFIDGFGTEAEWAVVGEALKGKVAICSRGSSSFFQKATAAVNAGAIATVVYNNTTGSINMDLTDYTKTEPCVSITQAQGAYIKSQSTAVTDEEGNVLYYTGTMDIGSELGVAQLNPEYYTMSSFSSWGVPTSLTMKPEITAPGGNIYSVDGTIATGDAYMNNSGTSMAAPQVAGMTAVIAQYIRDNGLAEKTGLTPRQLAQSLLMSTAVPMREGESGGNYWSVLSQGSGLANVGAAVTANSYIKMDENATISWADGKIKAELGDDADRKGEYGFSFTLNNLTDKEMTYRLGADFFTQDTVEIDGVKYLDTWTTPLAVKVLFLVDGVEFVPVSEADCDLNADGKTDESDAQLVLNYCAGLLTEIDAKADVNKDGKVTTYDAYLILDAMDTRVITVDASSKVNVEVKITLSDSLKAALDAEYVNGAYLEGYVFVKPTANSEGAFNDVTHSIPVLGFYGSWTDASMYDKASYAERLYGDTTQTYLGMDNTNALTVKYKGDTTAYNLTGNPYLVEETYPADRIAVNSDTTLNNYKISLIRNAAALATFVTNEKGEILYVSNPAANVYGAYYSTSNSTWYNTSTTAGISRSVKKLGVSEGDTIIVGVVAIPEYYSMGKTLTAEDVKTMITEGTLGDGAYLTTKLTIDDTAPQVVDITKSMVSDRITVTASDDNYIAAVLVTNKSGKNVYYAAQPEQTEKNQTVELTMDLTGVEIGKVCYVTVADYAGNETSYEVQWGGEEKNWSNMIFGWTVKGGRGSGKDWLSIDPDTLWWADKSNYTGTEHYGNTTFDVLGAEYVEGYVYYASNDGFIYVCEQGDWTGGIQLASWREHTSEVRDIAASVVDKKLFLLGAGGVFFEVDMGTGKLTEAFSVTLTNPRTTSADYLIPKEMAIDESGNFYAVGSIASKNNAYLYTWTLQDVVTTEKEDGTITRSITDLAPINNDKNGNLGLPRGYSLESPMLWDNGRDRLYIATGFNNSNSGNRLNCLFAIDVTTGKASPVNGYYPEDRTDGNPYTLGSRLNTMYCVPATSAMLPPRDKATVVNIVIPTTEVLLNATFTAIAEVGPWLLDDTGVIWSSSDESVLTVDADGMVKTVGVGTANLIATTIAEPHLQDSVEIHVSTYPTANLTAAIKNTDGNVYMSEFTTDNLTAVNKISAAMPGFQAGGYHDGKVYYHDGAAMYAVEAESMEVTALSGIVTMWQWSDATTAPLAGMDLLDRLVGICNTGTYIEVITPEAGTLNYFNLSSIFTEDPLAVIAYAGANTATADPGYDYYAITESGMMWRFSIYATDSGNSLKVTRAQLYQTTLDLSGVATMGSGSYGTMTYDENTNKLLVVHSPAGEAATLYAVDAANGVTANLGSFSQDVSYVAGVYQYTRATELTVRPSVTNVEMYVDETYDIDCRILPVSYTQGVTWSSSDESIATVDANGIVTPKTTGTVTITATSVDVNAEGNPANAQISVNILGLSSADLDFHAQITDATGTYWAKVNTAQMTVVKEGTATAAMTGAAAHGGKIYGTNSDYASAGNIYLIDPANGYATSQGSVCSADYAMNDGTTGPKVMTPGTWNGKGDPIETFNYPVMLCNANFVGLLMDYSAGNLTGFNMKSNLHNAGAIAYVGPGENGNYDGNVFYILENDGDLHQMLIYGTKSGTSAKYKSALTKNIANVGKTFANAHKMSMVYISNESYTGLLISDSSNGFGDLYFYDMSAETYVLNKLGRVPGATELVGLYTDGDIAVSGTQEFNPGTETTASDSFPISADFGELETAQITPDGVITPVDGVIAPLADSQKTGFETIIDETGVTVKFTEAVNVTNGKIELTYDPNLLTFQEYGIKSSELAMGYADADAGKVTFTYARSMAIKAGDVIGTLRFTYAKDYVNTTISANILERNEELLAQEPITIAVTYEVGGHNYEVTEAEEVTCLTGGYKVYTCTKCGHSYREELPAAGHDYVAVITEPTCTEMGYTTYTCSACQDTYTADYVNPNGHNYEADVVAPTCTAPGYTTYTCACGDTYVSDYVEPLGHNFGDWETVTAPGCEAKGQEKRTCACGEVEYRDIDPTGHNYGDWTVTKAATCTEPGEETRTCACGETETRELKALGHDYQTVEVAPTCTEAGYTQHICDRCGHSYISAVVNPTGHDYEKTVTAPTCAEVGYTTYTCRICGDSYVDDEVPTTAHTFGEWMVTAWPTCTEDGQFTRYCENCEAVETQEIPASCPAETFTDVDTNQWYHEGICYVVTYGLMNGMSETAFAPNSTLTRAQLVTILYRLEGEPSVEGLENPFTDVAADQWYTDAIIWAADAGVVNGISATLFNPNGAITREQIATILYRYAEAEAVGEDALADFADSNRVSDYAVDAMNWAVANGLINGMGDGTLTPQGSATRAQIATILMRYCQKD